MNNIPDTISKTIDVLAQKFGATGQALWQAIYHQQIIYGFYALFISLVCFGILVGCFFWGRKIVKDDWDEAAWLTLGIVVFFALVIGLGFGYEALTGLSNPTYAAIKDILSH